MTDLQTREQKLLDVEPEVDEFEFKLTGATGFEGGEELHVGDTVQLSVGGVVVGVGVQTKERKSKEAEGEMEEYLVRVVTIKATGARIK